MVVTGGLSSWFGTPFLTTSEGGVEDRPQFLRTTGRPQHTRRTQDNPPAHRPHAACNASGRRARGSNRWRQILAANRTVREATVRDSAAHAILDLTRYDTRCSLAGKCSAAAPRPTWSLHLADC